jgi:hypothetical protein
MPWHCIVDIAAILAPCSLLSFNSAILVDFFSCVKSATERVQRQQHHHHQHMVSVLVAFNCTPLMTLNG